MLKSRKCTCAFVGYNAMFGGTSHDLARCSVQRLPCKVSGALTQGATSSGRCPYADTSSGSLGGSSPSRSPRCK